MPDEYELVHKVLEGDLYSFNLLVKQYEKLVFTVAARLLSNKEDVEDVCQEVFIKVHRHLGKFMFQSKLSTWIAKIAYSSAINHLKKNRQYDEYPEDIDEKHFSGETPESLAIKKDKENYVAGLIAQMPVQYKTVLTLYHLNEFSYAEIEEITGYPEGTVKGYLFRARKLLKEMLEKYLNTEII